MEKYAKIINEETKLCEVGLGNPEKIFEERIIPEKSHEETIPAEYDEEGNIIKDEEIITVIDEEEHAEIITVGDWYKSLGMEKMEVEQAYNGSWYVAGHCPVEPEKTYAEKRLAEYPAISDQLDMIYWDKVNGTNLWQEKITEIKTKYPKDENVVNSYSQSEETITKVVEEQLELPLEV